MFTMDSFIKKGKILSDKLKEIGVEGVIVQEITKKVYAKKFSKKLSVCVTSVIILICNDIFNLNISKDIAMLISGIAISYMTVQGIIDFKK